MDLADMFRIIMTDKRKLVPFSAEYEMANKYMTLEKMRLGDRLEIEWKMDDVDDTVLLPILTLQPIIENAIYHGIETRLEGVKSLSRCAKATKTYTLRLLILGQRRISLCAKVIKLLSRT